jgi:integrase
MRKRHCNHGLRKLCDCARKRWSTCAHPWHFNFKPRRSEKAWRFSLDAELGRHIDSKTEAEGIAEDIRTAIRAGTFVRASDRASEDPKEAAAGASKSPTFATVAGQYATDAEGLAQQSPASQQRHGYDMTFLASVTVPPGVPFTEKPFADIIRADIKLVLGAKAIPNVQTYKKKGSEKEFTRTVGGKVAANRLYNRLQALWNWAIEEQYTTASPFIRTRKGKNRLKHDEHGRDRRLRDGEEAALLEHANPHLHDCIVAAIETGMRKGELLDLQWKQVRWLQNELYLPGLKTKTRRARQIPISPTLREILKRRQYGTIEGPNPIRFQFGTEHYVFGDEIGQKIADIKTAWENAVLKAHGVKPTRTATAGLSQECQAKLDEIDLHFHDLRHEAGSRKLEGGWPLHAVSQWLGHASITTTARYLNVGTDYLHELNERKPLALVTT